MEKAAEISAFSGKYGKEFCAIVFRPCLLCIKGAVIVWVDS